MTQDIMGIAGFGLNDSVFDRQPYPTDSWRMANVLLPESGRAMRFGSEAAEDDRTCCGFFWPPEARLNLNNLRRAPVPALWRALVDAADNRCVWKTSALGETLVAKMLAGHLHHLYTSLPPEQGRQEAPQPVISIPNRLDEHGQDNLLTELTYLGRKAPLLLWRPVAAALAWLKHVESDIRLDVEQKPRPVAVLYLGPDSIEMTKLNIKTYPYEGRTYILPQRSRPTAEIEYTGMDWAGNMLQANLKTQDKDTFWQCFGASTGLWKAIAEYTKDECEPQYYNSRTMWHKWNPKWSSPLLHEFEPEECTTLRAILQQHACELKRCTIDTGDDLEEYFEELFSGVNASQVYCLIVCGALVGQSTPPWLEKVLRRAGFALPTSTMSGKVWLAPGNAAIAEGAAIYGQKCAEGIPAYLDTLPPLSLLVDKEHDQNFEWCPLFKEREVLGGHEAQHTITDRFGLKPGSDTLQIWLSREEHEDTTEDKPSGLDFAMERIIRAWVRQMGSLKQVRASWDKKRPSDELNYAVAYAKQIFGGVTTDSAVKSDTPYRKATIQLEAIPETQVPLDVHVKMKPAAGLARVEFAPKQEGLFQKRRIRLDFDKMQPDPNVPQKTFGWPGLQEILVHPEDAAWISTSRREILTRFQECVCLDDNYVTCFDEIKKKFFRSGTQYVYNQHLFVCMPIAENGKLCTSRGSSRLHSIAIKISDDIKSAHPIRARKQIMAIISRSSWLYAAAPEAVKTAALAVVKNSSSYKRSEVNWCTEAAARMFDDTASLQWIFASILVRCNTDNQGLNINSIRSASTMLKFRSAALEALDKNQYTQLVKYTIECITNEANNSNFEQSFYQGILLLLYLLRIRKINQEFCAEHSEIRDDYEKAIELIKKAVDFHTRNQTHSDAKKIQKALKNQKALNEFRNFVYYEATVDVPTAITELAEEGDE